ncbi:hypothetical protein E2C01_000746 [Portunus trituberculatus]|uniref:Uncharacterized protein n=1 Tax=Portunus trituberculatus TaxID=210409 RepID=A0A5B7CF66_PORTR|nr:hypothetical protein [Portunus trituberculatus]
MKDNRGTHSLQTSRAAIERCQITTNVLDTMARRGSTAAPLFRPAATVRATRPLPHPPHPAPPYPTPSHSQHSRPKVHE